MAPDAQDGRYAYDRPWDLRSEQLQLRLLQESLAEPSWFPPVPTILDQNQLWQDPAVTDQIRTVEIPPRYGWYSDELTLNDILADKTSRIDMSRSQGYVTSEWSGGNGGYEATMRPTGPGYGGTD